MMLPVLTEWGAPLGKKDAPPAVQGVGLRLHAVLVCESWSNAEPMVRRVFRAPGRPRRARRPWRRSSCRRRRRASAWWCRRAFSAGFTSNSMTCLPPGAKASVPPAGTATCVERRHRHHAACPFMLSCSSVRTARGRAHRQQGQRLLPRRQREIGRARTPGDRGQPHPGAVDTAPPASRRMPASSSVAERRRSVAACNPLPYREIRSPS